MDDPHEHDHHQHEHDHHQEEHRHGHGGHSHGVSADADRRWLSLALGLIGVFMAGEVVAGLIARSLALLSDAAHMLTDAGAIVLALVAMRLAARPPRQIPRRRRCSRPSSTSSRRSSGAPA